MSQIDSNVFDHLLYYLSHIGKLKWEKFKQTVKLLTKDSSISRYSFCLRSLARLGHLDYNPNNLDHCVIAPAVLVETAVEDRYVLVGSRTPDFLSEVEKVVRLKGGRLDRIPEINAPTTISLSRLTAESLTEIKSLGIHIASAFSAKLSSVLLSPKLNSFPIFSRSIDGKKFDLDKLKYVESRSFGEDGLYRIPRYGLDVYVLKLDQDLRKVPRDWGEWLVLHAFRKTGLIHYEKKFRAWCMRERLIVPLLAERCATLCSGRPPERKDGFTRYLDVPIGIAFRLTKSLYQRLEVI